MSAQLGVFEFVIVLVVVTTIGKVVTEYIDRRSLPPITGPTSPGEVDALREEVADLGARMYRLEEERDFYRNLLEAPPETRPLPPASDDKDTPEAS